MGSFLPPAEGFCLQIMCVLDPLWFCCCYLFLFGILLCWAVYSSRIQNVNHPHLKRDAVSPVANPAFWSVYAAMEGMIGMPCGRSLHMRGGTWRRSEHLFQYSQRLQEKLNKGAVCGHRALTRLLPLQLNLRTPPVLGLQVKAPWHYTIVLRRHFLQFKSIALRLMEVVCGIWVALTGKGWWMHGYMLTWMSQLLKVLTWIGTSHLA